MNNSEIELSNKPPYTKAILIAVILAIISYAPAGFSEENVWEKLRQGGNIILMRHATADTSKNNALVLKINDCSVQRVLSALGREESLRIGKVFRQNSVPIAKILASQYCRTQDTAKLAFKRATSWVPLNLLDAIPESDRETRTEIISKYITAYRGTKNIIMITHQPNITALTFEVVEPGEFLVLKPDQNGEFDIVGRLTHAELMLTIK